MKKQSVYCACGVKWLFIFKTALHPFIPFCSVNLFSFCVLSVLAPLVFLLLLFFLIISFAYCMLD